MGTRLVCPFSKQHCSNRICKLHRRASSARSDGGPKHAESVGACWEFTKRQVKASGDSWGPDWSAPSQNSIAQIEFANYIEEHLQPEAMAVLNTPNPLGRVGSSQSGRSRLLAIHGDQTGLPLLKTALLKSNLQITSKSIFSPKRWRS